MFIFSNHDNKKMDTIIPKVSLKGVESPRERATCIVCLMFFAIYFARTYNLSK